MTRFWSVTVIGLLAANVSQAQDRSHVGMAFGTLQYEGASGSGPAIVAMRNLVTSRPLALRGDVRLHRQGIGGSPQSCAVVEPTYCTGRSDRLTGLSGGVSLVIDSRPAAATTIYYVPIQLGVSRFEASSSEWQAPTGLCLGNGQVTSCPQNPPFAQLDRRWTVTGATLGTGVGFRTQISAVSARLEFRGVTTVGRVSGVDVAVLLGRSRV